MGELNLAVMDAALKENYPESKIESQLNAAKVLYANIKKNSKTVDMSGRRAVIPIQLGWSQGIGARAENQALPDVQASLVQDTVVTLKYNYGHVQVSGPAIDGSRNNVGAFARAMDFEMDSMLTGFMRDINRQMISGDGIGRLAKLIAGTVNTNTTTITVVDSTNVYENMRVDIYTAPTMSGGTLISANNQVISVDPASNVVTLASPITVTTATPSTTFILRAGSKGVEMMGLNGIVDDGTVVNNLQGLDRQQYPRWKANVFANGGTLRNITEALLLPAYTSVEKTGKNPDLIIGPYNLRDNLAATLLSEKRFEANSKDVGLAAGFSGLKFNGGIYVPEEQAPNDRLFFLRTGLLELVNSSSPRWDSTTGYTWQKVSGVDSFEAYLKWYAEFGTNRANAFAVVRDLQ